MPLKRRAPGFPFSFLAPGCFAFSLEDHPFFPPTSYPALAGFIGIASMIILVQNVIGMSFFIWYASTSVNDLTLS